MTLTLTAAWLVWIASQSSVPNGGEAVRGEAKGTAAAVSPLSAPSHNETAAKFRWREELVDRLTFPVTKVILLSSNPRSGSSFLADVLTPSPVAASYFFEPLRFLYESVPKIRPKRRYSI